MEDFVKIEADALEGHLLDVVSQRVNNPLHIL